MKKLLFILVAIVSLCACSSDDDSSVKNQFIFDGKAYQIDMRLHQSLCDDTLFWRVSQIFCFNNKS